LGAAEINRKVHRDGHIHIESAKHRVGGGHEDTRVAACLAGISWRPSATAPGRHLPFRSPPGAPPG
jgi:hypothetical protein